MIKYNLKCKCGRKFWIVGFQDSLEFDSLHVKKN